MYYHYLTFQAKYLTNAILIYNALIVLINIFLELNFTSCDQH